MHTSLYTRLYARCMPSSEQAKQPHRARFKSYDRTIHGRYAPIQPIKSSMMVRWSAQARIPDLKILSGSFSSRESGCAKHQGTQRTLPLAVKAGLCMRQKLALPQSLKILIKWIQAFNSLPFTTNDSSGFNVAPRAACKQHVLADICTNRSMTSLVSSVFTNT